MGASSHLRPTLRLCGTDGDRPLAARSATGSAAPADAITAETVLREARRAILDLYGPCCAASISLVRAWATRLAETRPMPLNTRRALLAELHELLP